MKIVVLSLFLAIGWTLTIGQNLDIRLLRDINLGRQEKLDGTFEFLSATTYYPCIGLPILIAVAGGATKNPVIRNKGIEMGLSIMMAEGIALGLKYTVKRKRPYETYPDVENQGVENDPSFPSGHTSAAFSLATTLSLNFPKWYVVAPAYAWASSVAYSRVDLGLHYPSDILVGALVGSGSSILCHYLNRKIFQKAKQKAEIQE